MRLNLYLLTAFSLFSIQLFAQNAKLTGKVIEESGEALISASVVIDAGKGWAAVTDFDGNYEINVPAGSYVVTFHYLGKDDIKQKLTLAAGEHRVLNIKMTEQQKLMNEVVVSGSKYEKKLSEETVTLDVVKGSELNNQNITDLEDGMTKVPGVTIADGQVNIRGGAGWSYGAGSRVQVMVDDLPMLSGDAQLAEWPIIPMENVEQVEVIKGAASALYGSGALDGVVNVRTAYPLDEPYVKVSTYGGFAQAPTISPDMDWWGSVPRYQDGVNFVYREKFGQNDFVLSGAYNGTNGYLDSSASQDFRLTFKYRYRFKKIPGLNIGINGNGIYSWGETFFFWNGLDTAGYKPYPGTVTVYKDHRFTIDPFIDYYDKHDNQFKFLGRFFDFTNTNNTGQGSVSNTIYTELQYLKKIETKAFDLHLIFGTVNQYKLNNPPEGATNSLFGKNNEYDFSGYAQADFKFFKKLNVSIGARWEYIKQWHYVPDTTSIDTANHTVQTFQKLDTIQNSLKKLPYPLFRLGLNYQVAEATYIRGSVGQGFRYPSIAERYISTSVGPLGIFSNPFLNPEKGYNAEIAIRQGFKIGKWQGYGDLSAYWYRYDDMMEFSFGQFGPKQYWNDQSHDFGLGFASQNIGETRILGSEIELGTQGKIGPVDVQILVSYTYIDPKSLNWNDTLSLHNYQGDPLSNSGNATLAYNQSAKDKADPTAITYAMTASSSTNILKYRSPHLFKTDITLDWKGWEYNTNVQYNSFQQNVDYAFISPAFRNFAGSPFDGLAQYRAMQENIPIGKGRGDIVWNMSIAYAFKMGLRLGFIVNNLLNWEYTPRPAYFGAPRNYVLQVSYTFHGKKKGATSNSKP